MKTSFDVNTYRSKAKTPYIGLTSDVLPEAKTPESGECSQTGVSTRNVLIQTTCNDKPISLHPSSKKHQKHWYALRTTYGRENKASDFINEHGGKTFLPTITLEKIINGKKRLVEVSRLPNIFFAYGTEDSVKNFVYDNVNLPYLRFYYKHIWMGPKVQKIPMIVPDDQIRSLQIICESKDEVDTIVLQEEIEKFQKGEKVRVIEGQFKGVSGIVARYHGQQRVGLVVDGLMTAVTAYIPTAFLEKI